MIFSGVEKSENQISEFLNCLLRKVKIYGNYLQVG